MMSAAAVGCSAATRPADAAEAQPVAFLMGPYVNSVDGSTARVVWVTDAETPAGTVRLAGGSKGRLFRAEVQPIEGRQELLHVAALEGLLPGTRYDYAVEQGSARAEGSFRTAPSGEGPFRFVVYGDTRSRPESHNEVARAIAAEDPDFVVHTGDLVSRCPAMSSITASIGATCMSWSWTRRRRVTSTGPCWNGSDRT